MLCAEDMAAKSKSLVTLKAALHVCTSGMLVCQSRAVCRGRESQDGDMTDLKVPNPLACSVLCRGPTSTAAGR